MECSERIQIYTELQNTLFIEFLYGILMICCMKNTTVKLRYYSLCHHSPKDLCRFVDDVYTSNPTVQLHAHIPDVNHVFTEQRFTKQ